MALMECPECADALSSTAMSCPHCGYRAAPTDRPRSRSPLRGRAAAAVAAAYTLVTIGLMYAMPEYAAVLAVAALSCLIVELRSGVIRRAIRAG
jgi:predicted amidophosphoribosyltransferase